MPNPGRSTNYLASAYFLISAILLQSVVFSQSPQSALKITELKKDFYVFTTYQVYNGQQVSANSMYVVTDSGVVLFDRPWDSTQFQPLLDSIMAKHNKKLILSVATHFHEDRSGGFEFLKASGVKTYTTKMTDSILSARKKGRAAEVIFSDTIFTVGQYHFLVYYPGPGHSPDNIVAWFEKEKVLYGGCLIKSTEATDLGNLSDADLKQWPQSLKNLQMRFKKPTFIIAGHQSWKSTRSLAHTLKLLEKNAANSINR